MFRTAGTTDGCDQARDTTNANPNNSGVEPISESPKQAVKPPREDLERHPPRLFGGHKRIVEHPNGYKNFSDAVKLLGKSLGCPAAQSPVRGGGMSSGWQVSRAGEIPQGNVWAVGTTSAETFA